MMEGGSVVGILLLSIVRREQRFGLQQLGNEMWQCWWWPPTSVKRSRRFHILSGVRKMGVNDVGISITPVRETGLE
jgi:hypothetical protein